jgi:hypothetical protein
MLNVDDIIEYENGEQDEQDTIRMFQIAVNDGSAWRLQGSYGREAMALIDAGHIMLGKVAQQDYYGNLLPARTDVVKGSKGSAAYVKENQPESYALLRKLKL